MIRRIAIAVTGLALTGSSVFAQSLADAKKAIDAEQYVKAKGMLKNLTNTQPTNAEAFFQLGWVYLAQDYVDSAKVAFNKGVAADAKSPLNYVGLGVAANLNNDATGANASFKQAIDLTKKKDAEPYLYIGRGYLLGGEDGKVSPQNANAAIDALTKGKTANEKDPNIFIELGNAYRSQFKSNEAYSNYQQALTLDPKSVVANTAIGVLWKYADSFEAAESAFKKATTDDANFGPAYREWAETENREATNRGKNASEKIASAVAHFKQYLGLTDQSDETLLRYADFLVRAGKWDEVQKVASQLAAAPKPNARVYRYLGYAALENKDYKAAAAAMSKWFASADAKRLLPRDYLYQGRAQLAGGQDTTLAVSTLTKAIELDSTFSDVYKDIAGVHVARRKYVDAAIAYTNLLKRSKNLTFGDYLAAGRYGYFGFNNEQGAKLKADPSFKQDSSLLVKADSALSYMQRKMTTPNFNAALFRGRIAELRDPSRDNKRGLAKPFYEQVVALLEPKGAAIAGQEKVALIEAYDYLGNIYAYKEKDDVKAAEFFNKAKALDPADAQADFYFKQKAGAKSK